MSDDEPRTIPGAFNALTNLPSGVAAGRPSVIQLVFREKGALYAAYIPLMTDGGLFVPTTGLARTSTCCFLSLVILNATRWPAKSAGSHPRMPRAGAPRASAFASRATRRPGA